MYVMNVSGRAINVRFLFQDVVANYVVHVSQNFGTSCKCCSDNCAHLKKIKYIKYEKDTKIKYLS